MYYLAWKNPSGWLARGGTASAPSLLLSVRCASPRLPASGRPLLSLAAATGALSGRSLAGSGCPRNSSSARVLAARVLLLAAQHPLLARDVFACRDVAGDAGAAPFARVLGAFLLRGGELLFAVAQAGGLGLAARVVKGVGTMITKGHVNSF